ncbi:MAG: peptide deformylase [Lachnospiraceae bacterium]|jgi:peptide deformylase|nr:peptide deformylase [Lachnospiraceae bacterium]
MAIRSIRTIGDAILEKKTKAVKEMTGRLKELISDMFDTMYDANGVGLAAPQVGILKQIFVVDIGDGKQYVAINPEITVVGEEVQTGEEGCLSVPGKEGVVTRPMHIKVKALDQNMKEYTLDASGFLARAFSHENDHLQGILYTEKVEGELEDVVYEELEEEEEI